MTYHELVEEVKEGASRVDARKITDHVAIQVNIEGEAEGAFYIELMSGNIVVMPYEYYDRDVLLICQATQIIAILKGEMDPMQALSDGQIRAEGNVGRLALFGEIIKKTPLKKAAKKPAAKAVKETKAKAEKPAKAASAAKPAAKKGTKAKK